MINLKRLRSKIENLFSKGVPVLMYHRIFSPESDPWQLSVSPENFERQLQFLRKRYKIVSLDTLAQQLDEGKIGNDMLALSFDDCYSDNYHFARPLLEKYECPATFFVPSGLIGRNQLFWWDELQQLIMHTLVLPNRLELYIGSEKFEHNIQSVVLKQDEAEAQSKWTWSDTPPTERADLYLQIWKLLQPLQADQIRNVLDQIKLRLSREVEPGPYDLPMNFSQLNEIENSTLFNLAIHTSTHPKLAGLPEEVQRAEIVECKKWLMHQFGEARPPIAYPYGSYDEITIKILKEEKLPLGFTTNPISVRSNSHRFELGRLQVLNWNANQLEEFLRKNT
jgi:peptidoglycan/xylan/chitin deacetylase (PgdA/CDA1 family)